MEYIFSCKYEICFIGIVRGMGIFWEAICLQFCALFYNKKKKRRNMPVHWYLFIKVAHQSILFLTLQRKIKTSVNYYTQQYICMDGIICLITPDCGEDRNL